MCHTNTFLRPEFYYFLAYINVIRGIVGIVLGLCLIFNIGQAHQYFDVDHTYVTIMEALWLIYSLVVVLVAYSLIGGLEKKNPQRMQTWLCFTLVDIVAHLFVLYVILAAFQCCTLVFYGTAVFVVFEVFTFVMFYRLYRKFQRLESEHVSQITVEISLVDFRIEE